LQHQATSLPNTSLSLAVVAVEHPLAVVAVLAVI
jgi:hypothetical protein